MRLTGIHPKSAPEREGEVFAGRMVEIVGENLPTGLESVKATYELDGEPKEETVMVNGEESDSEHLELRFTGESESGIRYTFHVGDLTIDAVSAEA